MFPLELHSSSTKFEFSELLSLGMNTISTSWDGSINPWKFEAALAKDSKHFFLMGKGFSKDPLKPPSISSEYYEGLSNYEVIEFFFSIEDNKYIEYHLGPAGLWWAHSFTSPRVRSSSFIIPAIETYHAFLKDGWITILKIQKKDLLGDLLGPVAKINITATFKGENPPHASLALLGGEKANFHQPQMFIPINSNLFT
jgi:hypothetical protein